MKYLIVREYKRDFRDIGRTAVILLIVPIIVMCLYFLFKEKARYVGESIFKLPEVAYNLLGFENAVASFDLSFFNKIVVMIANVIVLFRACDKVFVTVDKDEINGTAFFMCNQLYSRREFILSKYVWSVISYIAEYTWFYIIIMMTGYFADMKELQASDYFVGNIKMMLVGVCMGVMCISIVYMYAVYGNRKDDGDNAMFVGMIIWGPLLIANVYKVIDIIKWIFRAYNMSQADLLEKMAGLEKLRYISPLTLSNPFNDYMVADCVKICLVAVIVSAACAGITIYLYERRDISE